MEVFSYVCFLFCSTCAQLARMPKAKASPLLSMAKARMARQVFYTEISCLLKSCVSFGGAWFPGICVLIMLFCWLSSI